MGRVLGPAKGADNEMCQWILKANGQVVPRCTVRPICTDEIYAEHEIRKRKIFDELIRKRWGDTINPPKLNSKIHTSKQHDFIEYEDEVEQLNDWFQQQLPSSIRLQSVLILESFIDFSKS